MEDNEDSGWDKDRWVAVIRIIVVFPVYVVDSLQVEDVVNAHTKPNYEREQENEVENFYAADGHCERSAGESVPVAGDTHLTGTEAETHEEKDQA